MFTIQQLSELISTQLLNKSFNQEPKNLYQPINYILGLGGKRIRPTLTLAACNLFSDSVDEAIEPAIAVEVFHNFTLVHDDIMDKADIRRGKQTIHKRWNENTAILSGDAMTIMAYKFLSGVSPDKLPRVLEIFNSFALGICEGQQYDMDFEAISDVTRTQYIRMIELKTAVLLEGALQIGAVIGGAGAKDIDRLGRFGNRLGIAFQLQDDLLDVYGDTQVFGKNIGGDIVANKKTILTIETLSLLDIKKKSEFMAIMNDSEMDNSTKISSITHLYNQCNVKSVVERLISDYFAQAMNELQSVSVPDSRKVVLRDLSDRLMNRNH